MRYDKKKNVFIIIIFVIVVIIFAAYFIYTDKNVNVSDKTSSSAKLLNDKDRFFTVSTCVTKYINFLMEGNSDNIYILLEKNYINKKHITKSNVFEHIDKLDGYYSQNTVRIYEDYVNEYITKYYVKYNLVESNINGNSTKESYHYIIILLNERDLTFSVIPYNGEVFKNEKL